MILDSGLLFWGPPCKFEHHYISQYLTKLKRTKQCFGPPCMWSCRWVDCLMFRLMRDALSLSSLA